MKVDNKKIVVMHLRSSEQTSTVLLGADLILLNVCRFLNKEKFKPIIVVLKDRRAKSELPLLEKAKEYNLATETIYLKHAFDFSAVSKLKELIAKHKVDILHCHEYKSDLLGFLTRRGSRDIKLITTVHGYIGSSINLKVYEYIDRFILIRYFDKIVAVSESIKNLLIRRGKELVILNAIDCEKFQREINESALRQKFNIDEHALVIGTIGRLSPEKGHYYLLKAAPEVIRVFPQAVFLIVGDGPHRKKLEKLILKANVKSRVIFTGFREDIDRLLSIMDIFVLPSLTEGLPTAILEAMASEKAIIATKVGGIPSIIEDKTQGLLVKPRSESDLMRAILKLLKDENLRRQLGERAKILVREKFPVEGMAENYENVYLEIMSG